MNHLFVFFIEIPRVWPIFCAFSDIFFMFHTATAIFQKCRKLHFFNRQLPFLTLDMNVKFNFKATFINIVYVYLQRLA
jgi:hypothetical protein